MPSKVLMSLSSAFVRRFRVVLIFSICAFMAEATQAFRLSPDWLRCQHRLPVQLGRNPHHELARKRFLRRLLSLTAKIEVVIHPVMKRLAGAGGARPGG